MAISDDLNSIRTHLEDDYTALEQLGVSVEDRNIENIKDMANQIYAKFPKTDYAEGSNITLSNTLKGKLDFEDGIVGIGDTKQESTEGYNLLPYPYGETTKTYNGVTITDNGDGTLTLNGTSTGYINFYLKKATDTWNLAIGTYYLSFGQSDIGITAIIGGDTDNISYTYGTSKFSFNVVNGGNVGNKCLLQIAGNKTFNNVVLKPMIAISSSATWEKYTGGIPSPNPSYPQEVKVVRGKNKWGGFSPFTKTQGGLTFTTNTDGSIDISGTATELSSSATIAEAIANNLFIKLEKGTYSVSGGGSNYVLQIYDKNANLIANIQLGTTSVTFTLTQTTEILCRVFIDSSGTIYNTKVKVQLEERKCSYFLSTL